jgi:putative tryptophan/tyrosine transport system substrate-binding protein
MLGRTNRREFIAALSGAAAWPVVARAQKQPVKIYRLGYLAPARIPHLIDALLTGLRELGYVEGNNIKIEYRYGGTATLDELAAQLVDLHPDAIITVATPPAIAAKRATTTIPIVMATVGDPVRSGIVASFARPGGNVTGVTLYGSELSAKRVEVLKEALPRTTRLAALGNARNLYSQHSWDDMEPTARALGLDPHLFMAQGLGDLSEAFAAMERERANAVVILSDALFNSARLQIIALASKHHLPAMYEAQEFVQDGGLISYGPDIAEMTRRSATLVDKVLKGVKPADLPIEQPTTFTMAINLKTAKALGLTVPHSLLARADEVID